MTQYSGKVIRKTPVTPTQASASGVWKLNEQAAAIRNNNWPVPGVPDPISRSVRFRSSASAYFNRTPAIAGNRRTWTWSGWVKRGTLGVDNNSLIGIDSPNANESIDAFSLRFLSSDVLRVFISNSSGTSVILADTVAVFRDPSAWYHIVMALDTTQATNSNGVKLYVNGVQQTLSFTAYTQNFESYFNSTQPQYIGRSVGNIYLDGYMAEINFIDGQALTPASFGAFDTTGVWQPLLYTGTYGTNGFYLTFADNSGATATTIGKDYSGNGNNWTPNNISVTAGTTYDWMLDSPTNWTNGTGNGVGNYAVLNPLNINRPTIVDGNLRVTGGDLIALATLGMTSGAWYAEMTVTTVGTESSCGIAQAPTPGTGSSYVGSTSTSWGYYAGNGNKYTNGSATAYGASYTSGDVIGIAFDADAGTLTFYKNNVSQGTAFTGLTNGPYYFSVSGRSTGTANNVSINFGQRPFSYTPPTGFKALNTLNLPDPTIMNGAQYMAATTYTGTGATQSISNAVNGVSMQPDLVWLKTRSTVSSNLLYDTSRGVLIYLSSNQTASQASLANSLTAFNSNGFTLGSDSNVNQSTVTFVGWQWQAGRGTTSTNTAGSITSTTSVNTTAGFSIVTYTGTGTTGTVGHGLGVAPRMMIFKSRSLAGSDWDVYHASTGNTGRLFLNTTAAFQTVDVWNNTSPTSTVFTINGARSNVNANTETYIAYCFAQVAGYSAFGSYTGNGSSDGPFVFCGFRPRFVMVKRTDAIDSWCILDTARNTFNVADRELNPNLSNAENTGNALDIVSNGFKWRDSYTSHNASGGTYIYAAFAENPFKIARAR